MATTPFSQPSKGAAIPCPKQSVAHPHENPDLDLYRTFSPSDVGLWGLLRAEQQQAGAPAAAGGSMQPQAPGGSLAAPGRQGSGFWGKLFGSFGKSSA